MNRFFYIILTLMLSFVLFSNVGCNTLFSNRAPQPIIDTGVIALAQLKSLEQDVSIVITAMNTELKSKNEQLISVWLEGVEDRLLQQNGNNGTVNLEDYKTALNSASERLSTASIEYDEIAASFRNELSLKINRAENLITKINEYNNTKGGISSEQLATLFTSSSEFAREIAEVRSQRENVLSQEDNEGFDLSSVRDIIRGNVLENVIPSLLNRGLSE